MTTTIDTLKVEELARLLEAPPPPYAPDQLWAKLSLAERIEVLYSRIDELHRAARRMHDAEMLPTKFGDHSAAVKHLGNVLG